MLGSIRAGRPRGPDYSRVPGEVATWAPLGGITRHFGANGEETTETLATVNPANILPLSIVDEFIVAGSFLAAGCSAHDSMIA